MEVREGGREQRVGEPEEVVVDARREDSLAAYEN